jgi:hypothetical protein
MNPYLSPPVPAHDPVYFETTGDDKLTPRQLTDLIDQVVSEMEMAKLQIERDTLDGATRHVERSLMLIKEIDIELWQSSRISGVPYKD